jgi:hypothetical protein
MGFLSGLAACLLLSTVVFAGAHNPTGGYNSAEYPLRINVFLYSGVPSSRSWHFDSEEGEGRANLYENGEPLGFDFIYRCGEQLKPSSDNETFPARWRKQGQKLEILVPRIGKPGEYSACEMKVHMKEFAYYRENGGLYSKQVASMKLFQYR